MEPAVLTPHPPVLAAGPGRLRRICCASDDCASDDAPTAGHAGEQDPVLLVYPSWWAPPRIRRAVAAARQTAGSVAGRPRWWLLARAAPPAPVVVEIAEETVADTDTGAGSATTTHPRTGEPGRLAAAVAGVAAARAAPRGAAVVIDVPGDVDGAAALAAGITDALAAAGTLISVAVDDARLRRLAGATAPAGAGPARRGGRWRLRAAVAASATALAAGLAAALAAGPAPDPGAPPALREPPAATLVEGRVAVRVPAGWPVRRITDGPGSARVEVISPTDPALRVHLTQAPAAHRSLAEVAEVLRAAIAGQPAGVFVDFDPHADRAGRPAVTYREVRADHDVRWVVLLDGPVRISVGCQSRPGGEDAIRAVCDRAVRSVHTLN